MADIRPVTITLRDRQTTGGSVPSDAVFGEPFINLFNGVLRFSGVTGGDYELSTQAGVFEVGSKLYNQKITNRLNINDNFIVSGDTGFISTYGGTSGAGLVGKFLSGTTGGLVLANISDIQGSSTYVQPGTNITTGGTAGLPTVNLVASPSVDNITYSGTSTGGNSIATNVSATTFYSAATNLETIILNLITGAGPHTLVQPGSNITTGGTAALPTVNLVASPSVNNITFSGTAIGGTVQAGAGTFTSLSATTLSGGTIYSGSTNLYSIFATAGSGVQAVQPGSNITTGGTLALPVVNVVASPAFNGISFSGTGTGNILNAQIITATAITDSNLTSGQAVYASTGGLLKTNSGFTYDDAVSTLFAQNINIGSPSLSGTATIWGDVIVIGSAISAFTSQLYIEDNTIELNYNPTASTTSTSLGSGWIIQDGDGIASGDIFLDIRGTATGVANRSFTTNLENMRVGETGTVSSPNGNFLLKETDILNGGSY